MIEFFFEDIEALDTLSVNSIENWLTAVCLKEQKELGDINLIFCSDEYLLKVNIEHLQHDYYTDIITFDYVEDVIINGDLFISIDRVQENALSHSKPFLNELHRVIVHGVLHLCGYKDKSDSEELVMRSKEDEMLALLD